MGVLKAKCCLYFALQSDSVLALTGAETLWSPVQTAERGGLWLGLAGGAGWGSRLLGRPALPPVGTGVVN